MRDRTEIGAPVPRQCLISVTFIQVARNLMRAMLQSALAERCVPALYTRALTSAAATGAFLGCCAAAIILPKVIGPHEIILIVWWFYK